MIYDAFPRGYQPYRHWLSRIWNEELPLALLVAINPNKATDTIDDQMVTFVTRLLQGLDGKLPCGGFVVVNCCDIRDPDPKNLQAHAKPVSEYNLANIREKLNCCDFAIAAWGITNYGTIVNEMRKTVTEILMESGKPVYCFSPKGLPIYCNMRNVNAKDGRWSEVPVLFQTS